MGLYRRYKVNEGVHIEGRGRSIDVVVKSVKGKKNRKEVDFKIIGIPEMSEIHISYLDGLVHLEDGIFVGVRNHEGRFVGRCDVEVHLKAPNDYKFDNIYPESRQT